MGFAKHRRAKNPRRGQMLVVVMMMITTVIIMFGMTVSVGHLVQSKINLQNSVDLASLSAASYQARHLNAISVANYRIRSVLKFFLLDSYVTQARFNNKFKTEIIDGGGSGMLSDPIKTLAVCEQAYLYHPVGAIHESGRRLDEQTNVCRNFTDTPTTITPLIASPFPGFNPIYIYINLTLAQIAAEFRTSCTEWQGQNGTWATWAIERAGRDTQQQSAQMVKVTNLFARDLGGDSDLGNYATEANQSTELTFRSNLIGSLVGSGTIVYLNSGPDRVLDINDLHLSQKKYGLGFVEPSWSGGCTIKLNSGGAHANKQTMTQGFSKSRPEEGGKTIAVGLVANADRPGILFWPQGLEPVMVAIAAAKPFGSRIGPPARYFASEGGNDYGNVATFPGDDGGNLSAGGLGHKQLLKYAYSRLRAPDNGTPELRPVREIAYMAYSPTIFDSMYFSIFPQGSAYAPIDTLPSLTIQSPLEDRGGNLPDPYEWSLPPLTTHYSTAAMKSGWSPEANDQRSGYQIKLISIDDLCRISSSQNLTEICSKEGTKLL
jgi:hypothetical protein